MLNKLKIGIVGGGISGIATAYYFSNMGYEVELIEADDNIGGRVGCDYIGDRRIEFGGKNIGRNYPRFRKFVSSMGNYEYEFFGINTSSNIENKKRTIDSEKPVRTLLNVVAMTGVKDFLKMSRMLSAIRANPDNGYLGGPYFRKLAETKDSQPITSHFGEKFCNNFVRPLTIRMNGCEPKNYYLGNFGSNLKMILDKYDQLVDGVYEVIEKFTSQITVRTSTKVKNLLIRDKKVYGVMAESNGQPVRLLYDAVVLCTPAPVAAGIVAENIPRLSVALKKIIYNPVAIAVAKYSTPIFSPEVRAQVFSAEYELSNAGAYGINDLDIVRYTFSGIASEQKIDEKSNPLKVLEIGERTLAKHLNVDRHKREGFVYRYFKNGLCAYAPHHGALMDEIGKSLDTISGLAVAGDYVKGAAIEACFYSAAEAAERIKERFNFDLNVKIAI